MAKAIVVPTSTAVNDATGAVSINYTASVIGPPNYSYGSDYVVNTGISVALNITAWRSKIIAQGAERGVTLLTTDVILFGLPG